MPTATCHCGAVKVEVPREPETITDCNCSICRRYGVLWAYYKDSEVTLTAAPSVAEATDDYAWGDKSLKFIRCKHLQSDVGNLAIGNTALCGFQAC